MRATVCYHYNAHGEGFSVFPALYLQLFLTKVQGFGVRGGSRGAGADPEGLGLRLPLVCGGAPRGCRALGAVDPGSCSALGAVR